MPTPPHADAWAHAPACSLAGRRILFVDGALFRSGAENLRVFAAQALKTIGADVTELVLGLPGEVAEELARKQLAHVIAPEVGESIKSIRPTLEVRRAIRRRRPELIVAGRFNGAYHTVLTMGGRWRRGGPRLLVEVMSTDDWMRPMHQAIWAGLLHSAHVVQVCSRMLAGDVATRYHVPRGRIRVVEVGADLTGLERMEKSVARARLGLPLDARVVGSVGTLRDAKRFDKLVRVTRRIEDRTGKKLWVLLSGHGPLRGEMEALTRELRLTDRVVFAPRMDNIGAQYAALDVFVLPSDYEGLPLVAPEAMAMRVPVIVSNVGGVSEVVEDGVTGCLFERNDLDKMESLILEALDGGEAVERRVDRAYRFVMEAFTADRYGRECAALYAETLGIAEGLPPGR